jgi:hypothetical protein
MAKVSKVERCAHALCGALARMTTGRPMQYRMARPVAIAAAMDDAAADAAVAYAIQKGWLIGDGEPPHSVCVTDGGCIRSAASRRPARP